MIIKEIKTKSVLTKSNHPEPWGEFLDVKYWEPIKNPQKYCGKEFRG